MANRMLMTLANSPIASGLIALLERLEFSSEPVLRVLTYHRVAYAAATPDLYPRVTVNPDMFDQHMRYLSQRCTVVSMEEVLNGLRILRPSVRVLPTRVNSERSARPHMAEADLAQSPTAENQPAWFIPETGETTPAGPDARAEPSQVSVSHGKVKWPKRAVLITFDDAYTDFTEYALPILQHYQLPATLFVPTAFPGNTQRAFWWDRLYSAVEHAYNLGIIQTPLGSLSVSTAADRRHTFSLLRDYVKSLPHAAAIDWVDRFCADLETPRLASSVLTWDELRKARAAGITLGAHTRNHPMMNRITPDEVRAEAVGSWQDLRRETGETLPIFAYPSGGYNRLVTEILKQEGFELAFTTNRGLNPLSSADLLQIKRINVGPQTSLNLLRAQLLRL